MKTGVVALVSVMSWWAVHAHKAQTPRRTEAYYVRQINAKHFAGKARIEATTVDGARCDILTPDMAIEVDYAPKWAEAIGQSLYYGIAFDRNPGIYLLMKGNSDRRYWSRCLAVCSNYGITLRVHKLE